MIAARPIERVGRIVTVLATVMAFAACDGDTADPTAPTVEPGGEGAQATTLSVYLKDAPGDVDSVWVQVDDVVLVGGDGPNVSVLDEPTELINVTALTDGEVLALAEELELELESVSQVRFVLGAGVLQASDGDVFVFGEVEHPNGLPVTGELKCPSCTSSGIKVKLGGDLEMGEGENGLLLDFDVSQSFGKEAGKSGKWVMRPVIHATQGDPDDIEDDDVGGEIHGTVALGEDEQGEPLVVPVCGGEERTLEAFVPVAIATTLQDEEGEALVFSGETEEGDDGFVFTVETAEFDSFDMGHESATTFDEEQLVWSATVEPAQVTLDEASPDAGGVAYVVTSVSCEPLVEPGS